MTEKEVQLKSLEKAMASKEYNDYKNILLATYKTNEDYIFKAVSDNGDFSKCEYSINDAEFILYKELEKLKELFKNNAEMLELVGDEIKQLKTRIISSLDMGQSRDWRVYSKLDFYRFENKFIKYIIGETHDNGVVTKCYIGRQIDIIKNSIADEKQQVEPIEE